MNDLNYNYIFHWICVSVFVRRHSFATEVVRRTYLGDVLYMGSRFNLTAEHRMLLK